METEGFFQFEIINVLVSSFRFIWIPMLWVNGRLKYFNSFSVGTIFIRQNVTSTGVRFWFKATVIHQVASWSWVKLTMYDTKEFNAYIP